MLCTTEGRLLGSTSDVHQHILCSTYALPNGSRFWHGAALSVSQGILLASMDEGDLDRCACPLPNCRTKLPDQAAQQLLRGRQLERFQHLAAHSYANRSPTTQWSAPSQPLLSLESVNSHQIPSLTGLLPGISNPRCPS